jgi:5-methylcytosine-specific restriction endonuclease McrA
MKEPLDIRAFASEDVREHPHAEGFERRFEQWTKDAWRTRREKARRLLQRGTAESWSTIRRRIWERDKGVCQVCGYDLNNEPQYYELGHKVDRVAGGSDMDDNLCVQCNCCNRLKPVHETLEEYDAWANAPTLTVVAVK